MILKNSTIQRWIDLLSRDGKNTKKQVRDEMIKELNKHTPGIKLPMEEIKELYCVQKWSAQELADKYFVTIQTILNRLRNAGIEIEKDYVLRKLTPHLEDIEIMYLDKMMTTTEIAEIYNVSDTTVRKFLKKNNIPIRNPHYKGKKYKKYA